MLEVGPGQELSALVEVHPAKKAEHVLLSASGSSFEIGLVEQLHLIGKFWLEGVQVNWQVFHKHEMCRRVALPTYPFERQRYWIDAPRKDKAGLNGHQTTVTGNKKSDISTWFYTPIWKQTLLSQLAEIDVQQNLKGPWLVFVDACDLGTQLVKRLALHGQTVIQVRAGERFAEIDKSTYMLNPGRAEDYKALLEALSHTNIFPQSIVHMWTVTEYEGGQRDFAWIEDVQNKGFYSLLFLAQALEKQSDNQQRIWIVSNDTQSVTGEETVYPEKVTVLGPCKVIPQEYAHIICQSIDIRLPQRGTFQERKLLDLFYQEITTLPTSYRIAYRGGKRWVQSYEPVRLEHKTEPIVRESGVYLITGGLGGIGLALAQQLARSAKVKVALVGRGFFPESHEWNQWLDEHEEINAISQKIRILLALEEAGSEVSTYRADASDLQQMQAVLQQVNERFGRVHGVIHAAGLPAGGLIQLKTRAYAENILAAKVQGSFVLEELFKAKDLDFILFCSSLNSLLGGLGQVDYCAANACLDAFAQHFTQHYGKRAFTINWDTWGEVGMGIYTKVPDELRKQRDENLKQGILSQEGGEAFNRVLASGMAQVLVSTRDLQYQIDLVNNYGPGSLIEKETSVRRLATHPRPELLNPYVAPGNTLEESLAHIWQDLLGIEAIGIHDSFFELGGHSLLATKVMTRIQDSFHVALSVRNLFEAPTVAELALFVLQKQKRQENNVSDKIERINRDEEEQLLANLHELSDEDVDELLELALAQEENL